MSDVDNPKNGDKPPERIIDGASGPFAWRPPLLTLSFRPTPMRHPRNHTITRNS